MFETGSDAMTIDEIKIQWDRWVSAQVTDLKVFFDKKY